MNPPNLPRKTLALCLALTLPLQISTTLAQEATPRGWQKTLTLPSDSWRKTQEKYAKDNPKALSQAVPPSQIQAEFIPTKNAEIPELIRNLQIEMSRTSPPPTGSSKSLNENQHWMEYAFPRRNKYGAIHFIETRHGVLTLHLEKSPYTNPQDWESQKTMLKGIVLSQKEIPFCLGLKLDLPPI